MIEQICTYIHAIPIGILDSMREYDEHIYVFGTKGDLNNE